MMRCSACGFENAPGIKFCGECGKPLGPAPKAAPDPRAYTPRHLAEKILSSRSALEGERKKVTVLFADVKGSMELAAGTAQLVSGYFRLRELGPAHVYGLVEPVAAFELEDVGQLRTRFAASQARGLSRFVGRGRTNRFFFSSARSSPDAVVMR